MKTIPGNCGSFLVPSGDKGEFHIPRELSKLFSLPLGHIGNELYGEGLT